MTSLEWIENEIEFLKDKKYFLSQYLSLELPPFEREIHQRELVQVQKSLSICLKIKKKLLAWDVVKEEVKFEDNYLYINTAYTIEKESKQYNIIKEAINY